MTVFSAGGEVDGKGMAFAGGFTDEKGAPSSDGSASVFKFGAVTITVTSSIAKIVAGGLTVEISGAGFAITGGDVTHDGKDIGATHKHDGVTSGSDETGTPT